MSTTISSNILRDEEKCDNKHGGHDHVDNDLNCKRTSKVGSKIVPTTSNRSGEHDDKNMMLKSYNQTSILGREEDTPWRQRMIEIFQAYWILGLISFGGPQAQFAILHDHLVIKRNWMSEEAFTELFAIGQGIPGPTAAQLVISTGMVHAGPLGGLLAFFLYNLPGLILLTSCGILISSFVKDPNDPPFYLVGLPPAAISLVFKAFYGLSIKLDKLGIITALLSACVTILINGDSNIPIHYSQWILPVLLAIGGIVTWIDSKRNIPLGKYPTSSSKSNLNNPSSDSHILKSETDLLMKRIGIPIWVGACIFLIWITALVTTITLNRQFEQKNEYLDMFDVMYRTGSIIFGGGQVVLPMLQAEVVPTWMTKEEFLQGLGLAQSIPGPVFNFAAYIGATYKGISGALLCYIGIFSPGIILIYAVIPFWARLRCNKTFKVILQGVNSAAIGLVGAACIILWEKAIQNSADAIVFSVAATLTMVYNTQAPFVVLSGGVIGAILCNNVGNLGQIPFCDL